MTSQINQMLVVTVEINQRPSGPQMSSNPVSAPTGTAGLVKSSDLFDLSEYHRTASRQGNVANAIMNMGQWWHFLNSTWLLWTTLKPADVISTISQDLENQDRVIVAPVTAPFEGWLPTEAWEWVNQRLQSSPTTPFGRPPN